MSKKYQRGYWTKDRIILEAKRYVSVGDFSSKSPRAYNAASNLKILSEVTRGMARERYPNNYWTEDRCREEVKNYKTFDELREKCPSLYNTICKLNLNDELINHLPRKSGRKPRGYWTKERCTEAAKKYEHRAEFQYGRHTSAYNAAKTNNWLEEICTHMKSMGHEYRRGVYSLLDHKNKIIYVGLSGNPKRRYQQHLQGNTSAKNIIKNEHEFRYPRKFYEKDDAVKKEKEIIKYYKTRGWNVVNKAAGGSLGKPNNPKWTKETLIAKAKEYLTRSSFEKGASGAYDAARRMKILDKICEHMPKPQKISVAVWTPEAIAAEAKKYQTRSEFKAKAGGAVYRARRIGIYEQVCSHMGPAKTKGYRR